MRIALTHPDHSAADVADALRSSGFEVDAPVRVGRTVLDTFDGRLHRADLRLEQVVDPGPSLVLFSLQGAPSARLEHRGLPAWPADLPDGPFRARIAGVTRERALRPVLTITSTARTARRADGRRKAVAVVELHEDIATPDTAGSPPSWIAEVVGLTGHDEAGEAAVTRLMALGLRPLGGSLAEAVASAVGVPLSGYDSSPTVPLDARDDVLVGFRRVLANLHASVCANLQGTIDDTDSEFLHDLRVAVRRARSVLAQGKDVLPPDVRDRYREELGWLGQITGPPRDLDVYLLGWEGYVAPLEAAERALLDTVRELLEERRVRAHRELSAALAGERTRTILDGFERWLTDPDADGDGALRLGPVVASRIAAAQKRVLRDGRAITDASPAERLHDLRKDAKKLRYLLECFGSLFPAKPRRGFVAQLKSLQDNLGEHQDAEVHLAELRALARELHRAHRGDADVLLAMGRLSEHLERRRIEERVAFAGRFAGYDTKANRRALDELLRAVGRA